MQQYGTAGGPGLLPRQAFEARIVALLDNMNDPSFELPSDPFDVNLWDLGFDSSLIVELIIVLEDEVGMMLPLDLSWDQLCIRDLYNLYIAHFAQAVVDRRDTET
jgi:hypothetical protein